jgi:two-component system OmpR family response regulator
MRVLVVEDDRQISRQLVQALTTNGYVADTARNGEDGRFLGQTESYDAIILDLGLPVLDGLSVLQSWRQEGMKTPVLVLTARDTWTDKVKGLRAGADDYLAKPFHMEELIARVEALIRRDKGSVRSLLTCGDVQLDAATGSTNSPPIRYHRNSGRNCLNRPTQGHWRRANWSRRLDNMAIRNPSTVNGSTRRKHAPREPPRCACPVTSS